MKKLFDSLFVAYCLLWCVIHFFRYIHHPLPFLNNYLTDILFVPVAAHISKYVIICLVSGTRFYHHSLIYLFFIATYTSVIFEYVMPKISMTCTGDMGDVLAYFSGGLFYYYFHQGKNCASPE